MPSLVPMAAEIPNYSSPGNGNTDTNPATATSAASAVNAASAMHAPPAASTTPSCSPMPTASESDAWLVTVMRKESNRAMLAHLERALISFVNDSSLQSLPFPPKGAYYRRVCCAVAQRFQLAFRVDAMDPAAVSASRGWPATTSASAMSVATAIDGPMRLVLLKTPESAVPATRLADLVPSVDGDTGGGQMGLVGSQPSPSWNAAGTRSADSWRDPSPPTGAAASRDSAKILGKQFISDPPARPGASNLTRYPPGEPRDSTGSSSLRPAQCDSYTRNPAGDIDPLLRPATVLRRPVSEGRNAGSRPFGSSGMSGSGSSGPLKNVTEEEYETARARIFMGDGSRGGGDGSVGEALQQLSLDSGRPGAQISTAERVARGPVEGSIGFGRGRGRHAANSSPSLPNEARQAPSADALRAADSHDPDFDRCYSRWQAPSQSRGLPVHPFFAPQLPHAQHFHMPQSQHDILSLPQEQSYQRMIRHAIPPPAHRVVTHDSGIPGFPASHSPGIHGMQSVQSSARYGLYSVSSPLGHEFAGQGMRTEDGGQNVAMLLPSHTPQPGENWEAPQIEPHVARSSGILRPRSEMAGAPENALLPQASYGLDSLADFPSLSAETRRDVS